MTNTTTDRKSPLLIGNQMSSSLKSRCVAHSGVEECWDVREGLEPQAWPGPAQSCMLLVTFGETLVVSL